MRAAGSRLFAILLVLSVPVFLIATNVIWAFHETRLYRYGFDKYEITQVTGIAREDLVRAARELIDYFDSNEALIDVKITIGNEAFALFNEREVRHLGDVKELLHRVYWVQRICLLYLAAYITVNLARNGKRAVVPITGGLTMGSFLTIALVIIAGIGSLLSFETLFVQFHLISFSNDLWRLDPTTDYLLMMFPTAFWLDSTLLLGLTTVTESALLWTGSRFLSSRIRGGPQESPTRD